MSSSDGVVTRAELLGLVVRVAVLSALSYYTAKWVVDLLDPTRKQKQAAQKKARRLLDELGIGANDGVSLDEYEMTLASNLVRPDTMATSWEDIAGLDEVVRELRETVIVPIQRRDLFSGSELTAAPRGVLLHGPPGCGKTMIARATARESGARFIALDGAALHDKWYGESQKLAGALFSLARKLQPTIVFIDEIDSLLRVRDSHDHEATAMIKAQFMQLWDGLEANKGATVVIMGATNRPKDVDRAILRRMPATFHVGLPDLGQRKSILLQILRIESVAEDVDYARLAQLTEGYSGSDIRELCRTAAVYRVRDIVRQEQQSASSSPSSPLRPITNADLLSALAKMRESKLHCGVSASASAQLNPINLD